MHNNKNAYDIHNVSFFLTLGEGASVGADHLLSVRVRTRTMAECIVPYNTEVKEKYHLCAGGVRGEDSCQVSTIFYTHKY